MMTDEHFAHLVIIGDDLKQVQNLTEVLEKVGYQLTSAANIGEGVRLAELNPPALIIVSFASNQNDAAKFRQIIKQCEKLYSIPLLIVSANINQTETDEDFVISDDPLLLVATVTKLIERRRFQSRLNASEKHFTNLFQSEMMGIFFWEKRGLITDANNAFLRMVGHTREDLHSGKLNWIEMTPEKYLQSDFEILKEVEKTKVCQPFEKEFIRKDKSLFPVLIGGAFIDGDEDAGVSFILDIEDRKSAESKLLSEQKFNFETINSLPGIFYIVDANGMLIRWNESFAQVTEYAAAEICKMSAADFFHEHEKSVIRGKVEEGFATGEAMVEAELISKSGRKIPHFFTGRRITLDQKVCLVGMGIDLSERRRIEDSLQKS